MREAVATNQFVTLPTTLYLDGLDTYVRRYLKSNATYRQGGIPLDAPGGAAELEKALLDVAVALLLADGVVVKTTGDNVSLALLARAFGAHATAEMIRRGTIEFAGYSRSGGSLVDPSGARLSDGSPVPPGNPIFTTFMWDQQESDVFRGGRIDPEAAATAALRRHRDEIQCSESEIRELVRRATKHTHIIGPEGLQGAFDRVSAAYSNGTLEPLGLSPEIARTKNEYQDHAYVELIENVAHAEVMLDLELDQFQMPEKWEAIRQFTREIASGREVLHSIDQITELRGMPDLYRLFSDGVLRFDELPDLMRDPATIGFRRWIWDRPDPRDAEAMASDFVGEVSGRNRGGAVAYLKRVGRLAFAVILQDRIFDAMQVSAPDRTILDVAAALLSDAAVQRFRRRPPRAFFDEVLQPRIAQAQMKRRT